MHAVAYSKALKSGWTHEVWGRKSLSGSRGGAPVEVWGQEIRYIQSLQLSKWFSTQVCCRVRPPSSPPPKTLRICANPMTQHDRGRMGTCPPVATLLYYVHLCIPVAWRVHPDISYGVCSFPVSGLMSEITLLKNLAFFNVVYKPSCLHSTNNDSTVH